MSASATASATASAPAPERTEKRQRQGARSVQTWRSRRRYGNTVQVAESVPAVGMALAWIMPWDADNYPGRYRGIVTLLGKRWCRSALWRWSTGAQRTPPNVLLALAVEIERRCEIGLAIAAQLRAEADAWRPFDRSQLGFLAIDPETGRNKRWRG